MLNIQYQYHFSWKVLIPIFIFLCSLYNIYVWKKGKKILSAGSTFNCCFEYIWHENNITFSRLYCLIIIKIDYFYNACCNLPSIACTEELAEARQQLGMIWESTTRESDWLTHSALLTYTHSWYKKVWGDLWLFVSPGCVCTLPGCECLSQSQNKLVQLAINLTINSCGEFEFIKFTD